MKWEHRSSVGRDKGDTVRADCFTVEDNSHDRSDLLYSKNISDVKKENFVIGAVSYFEQREIC
jgi:hypothetical protein